MGTPDGVEAGDREQRVLEKVHRVALFLDERIGWNRIGVALSVSIIAVAAVVLYRILHEINAADVVDALLRHRLAGFRAGGFFCRRRLFHAHVLRPVRLAHDRAFRCAVLGGGSRRLHQLFGWPQCRGERVHRRRGALPPLLGLGSQRARGRQDLLRGRADILARQRHRARPRHRLRAARRQRHQPAAGLVQPCRRDPDPDRAHALRRLGVAAPARGRRTRLERAPCHRVR